MEGIMPEQTLSMRIDRECMTISEEEEKEEEVEVEVVKEYDYANSWPKLRAQPRTILRIIQTTTTTIMYWTALRQVSFRNSTHENNYTIFH